MTSVPPVSRLLVSLGNETHKGLLIAWSERLQILVELPFYALLILLLGPLLNAGHEIAGGQVTWSLHSGRTSLLVLAFVPAMVLYFQAVKLFWRLLGEIQSGTFEQVCLSPLPAWLVAAAGRVVAALIETLLVVSATYGIVSAFVPLHYTWTAAALLPAALLILTGIGYSLIIGGLTLIWKRIQLLQEGLLLLVVIFAVSALPVFTVPGWFAGLGRVFPVTSAVASLYGVMIGHHPVTALWGPGGLIWVVVTAAGYLTAGIAAFRAGERMARVRGTLARY
jgi:ABC-2 type transport system permease protein